VSDLGTLFLFSKELQRKNFGSYFTPRNLIIYLYVFYFCLSKIQTCFFYLKKEKYLSLYILFKTDSCHYSLRHTDPPSPTQNFRKSLEEVANLKYNPKLTHPFSFWGKLNWRVKSIAHDWKYHIGFVSQLQCSGQSVQLQSRRGAKSREEHPHSVEMSSADPLLLFGDDVSVPCGDCHDDSLWRLKSWGQLWGSRCRWNGC